MDMFTCIAVLLRRIEDNIATPCSENPIIKDEPTLHPGGITICDTPIFITASLSSRVNSSIKSDGNLQYYVKQLVLRLLFLLDIIQLNENQAKLYNLEPQIFYFE